MMLKTKVIYIYWCLLVPIFCFSQQSSKDSIHLDSLGKINTELDSSKYNFEPEKIDSLWLRILHRQLKIQTGFKKELETDTNQFSEKTSLKTDTYEKILTTEHLKKQLKDLNEKTPIIVQYNKSLESIIRYFLRDRRDFYKRLVNLSQYYFPLFEEILDKYDIPQELKYLAIVESALNPRAKSRVGASGLWQFMYSTGKIYGMEINSYVDERYDPIISTEAACRYLKNLYEMFDDWALVLAAYNSGPGNVSKAIRRSGKSRNFWQLRYFLPKETAGYFPIFLATMYIFEHAEFYDLKQTKRQFHYAETDTIQIKKRITFEQISRLLDIDKHQVAFLNPSYRMDVIPATENHPRTLRLPISKLTRFISNRDQIFQIVKSEKIPLPNPDPAYVGGAINGTYIVRSGDSLWSIARKFPGVSAKNLISWNRHIKNSVIRPGMKIKVCKKC